MRNKLEVETVVDARKEVLGREDALEIARSARNLISMKGGRVQYFDLRESTWSDDALAQAMLGPTGNLRAPTLRVGSSVLVGFDHSVYDSIFADHARGGGQPLAASAQGGAGSGKAPVRA